MAFGDSSSLLDDFDQADEGPPITGWTDVLNGLEIVSSTARGNAHADLRPRLRGLRNVGNHPLDK